ncbi:hypothetical protein ACRALDRAFT_213580 [Sodiomyces alcalophilus JCM 7366]|uniref:uncharacterized protein n=1 Tax=Sodiomyces alcalophilus JCM 7366 TaxID=591952 RepID=UPI0039B529CC
MYELRPLLQKDVSTSVPHSASPGTTHALRSLVCLHRFRSQRLNRFQLARRCLVATSSRGILFINIPKYMTQAESQCLIAESSRGRQAVLRCRPQKSIANPRVWDGFGIRIRIRIVDLLGIPLSFTGPEYPVCLAWRLSRASRAGGRRSTDDHFSTFTPWKPSPLSFPVLIAPGTDPSDTMIGGP